MRGTMRVIRPDGSISTRHFYDQHVSLDDLKQAVGGYIEIVPHFHVLEFGGQIDRCIVLCNDAGKLHDMPINAVATALWRHSVPAELVGNDVLVGPVAILTGDGSFLSNV